MAKRGVTHQEVKDAAEELYRKGIVPNSSSVRELLKKGSFTTIQKHLSQVDAQVPPDLESLWAKAFADATKCFSQEKTAWHQQRQAVLQILEDLEMEKRQNDKEIERLQRENDGLRDALEKQQAAMLKLINEVKKEYPTLVPLESHSPDDQEWT